MSDSSMKSFNQKPRSKAPGFIGESGNEKQMAIEQEATRLLEQFRRHSLKQSLRAPEQGLYHDDPVIHGHTTFNTRATQIDWRPFQIRRTESAANSLSRDNTPSKTRSPRKDTNLLPRSVSSSSALLKSASPAPPTPTPTRETSDPRSAKVSSTLSQTTSHAIKASTPTRGANIPRSPNVSSAQLQTPLPAHHTPIPRPSVPVSIMRVQSQPKPSRISATRDSASNSTRSSPDLLEVSSDAPRRRSNRQKTNPITYNLRVLSGLEPETSYENSIVDSTLASTISSKPLPQPSSSPNLNQDSRKLLLNREFQGRSGNRPLHQKFAADLKEWKSWTGASSDVIALSWSPDGTKFAAGSTASPDAYNRKNNLLMGDLVNNTLYELPDHWITNSSGERLYASVTDTKWVGRRLYTASYDNTVKIWDLEAHGRPSQAGALQHDSEVVVMAISDLQPNLIATGTKGFQLWRMRGVHEETCETLPIQRTAQQKTGIELRPTTLAWGPHHTTKRFLIGGMMEKLTDEQDFKVPSYGHIGLWQIDESSISTRKLGRGSQNVFDIQWDPSQPRLATATTIHQAMRLPSGTRSVVQVYDYIPKDDKFVPTSILPCKAADINSVEFCPMDSVYVTAGCTDGRTYVWDTRYPERILHELAHGKPLDPLNHEVRRELSDFGVSVGLWGSAIDQFYTGASDGCLNRWDIRRSPEDVLLETHYFKEGIASGAFSDDKSHLLIGDRHGGISVLSTAPISDPENKSFSFKRASDQIVTADETSGAQISNELFSSGQLCNHPIYGAVQGPKYEGPFAFWARGLQRPDESLSTNGRPKYSSLKSIPLLEDVQLRQFEGAPPQERAGLDAHAKEELERQMRLANTRNVPRRRVFKKRKRSSTSPTKCKRQKKMSQSTKAENSRTINPRMSEIIDLTGDSPELRPLSNPNGSSVPLQSLNPVHPPPSAFDDPDSDWEDIDDRLEEDYWWPDSSKYDANICESD